MVRSLRVPSWTDGVQLVSTDRDGPLPASRARRCRVVPARRRSRQALPLRAGHTVEAVAAESEAAVAGAPRLAVGDARGPAEPVLVADEVAAAVAVLVAGAVVLGPAEALAYRVRAGADQVAAALVVASATV